MHHILTGFLPICLLSRKLLSNVFCSGIKMKLSEDGLVLQPISRNFTQLRKSTCATFMAQLRKVS